MEEEENVAKKLINSSNFLKLNFKRSSKIIISKLLATQKMIEKMRFQYKQIIRE